MTEGNIAEGNRVPTTPYNDPSARFWSLYLDKSEKSNKTLVQNWKGDMDSILIFAGLFSASVTTFIIESYKNLSPDPNDAYIAILTRISQQLESGANTSAVIPVSPLAQMGQNFAPTKSSIACNTLWFLSLSLSLACALSATLVDQWARYYIHATDSKPHPRDRARISAFLFDGLKKYRMSAVVEAIPTFLHVSLFLFFAGLFFFLQPVNPSISFIVLGLLIICCVLYFLVTVLPVIHLDSPYQTPASVIWWRILQTLRLLKYRSASGKSVLITGTINDAREKQAVTVSSERDERDFQAMSWTISSLRTTHEMEAFAEVIPTVVAGFDYSAKLLLHRLLHHEDLAVRLGHRIPQLLTSCTNGVLEEPVALKRAVTCLAAIWSLTMMSIPAVGDTTYSPSPRSGLRFNEDTLSLVTTTEKRLVEASGTAKSAFLVVARALLDAHSGRARWFQDKLSGLLNSTSSHSKTSLIDEEEKDTIWKNLVQLNRQQSLLAKTIIVRKNLSSTLPYVEMEGVAQHQARLFSSLSTLPEDIVDVGLIHQALLSIEQFQTIVNQAGFSLSLLYMAHVLEPGRYTLHEPFNTIRRAFFRMNFDLHVTLESQQLLVTYLDMALEQEPSGKATVPQSMVDIILSFTKALKDPVCVMKARSSISTFLRRHRNYFAAIQALERLEAILPTKQPEILELFSSHMYTDSKSDSSRITA